MKSDLLNSPYDRRALLRRAFWTTMGGAVAFNELGLGPTVQSLFQRLMWTTAGRTLDSRALIAEALSGGPSLFRWTASRALAASAGVEPLSVVHIKVVNHVATPLLFRLGAPDADFRTTTLASDDSQSSKPAILNNFTFNEAADRLAAAGIGELSQIGLGLVGDDTNQTYGSKFRMNGWFARWLHNPQMSGLSPELRAELDLSERYVLQGLISPSVNKEFNHNAVGLQCALGLAQTHSGFNHSLKNLKLRLDQPDLGLYVADKGIIQSPLGVSVFMMGGRYDKAEGQQDRNVLLKNSAEQEEPAVDGAPVEQHADSIAQSILPANFGYLDTRGNDSLTQTFDKLVSSEPKLRREMEAARQKFREEITALTATAELEKKSAFTSVEDARFDGCLQSKGLERSARVDGSDLEQTAQPAKGEFLAQIHYTSRLLRIPGRPVRNFSLFLNTQDVDARNIDVPTFGEPSYDGIQCLTYIEGMRQLAIGLNALARVIEEKGNVVVVVTSEGGRDNDMNDGKGSFGLVMGPKSMGIDSALYANLDQISTADSPQAMNPAGQGNEQTYNSDHPYLFDLNGNVMTGAPNVGDLQVGVVRALAEMAGGGMSLEELGNFVRVRS